MDLNDPPFHESALDRLREALEACRSRQGGVVTVTGPVGAGRTRLLECFGRLAVSQGVLPLDARGARTERNLPFGLLLQLLQQAPLDQDASGEVCCLVSEGIAAADQQDGGARLPARVLDGLVGILLRLAERGPLVLVVDDFQYTDPQSFQCLRGFTRRTSQFGALVVFGHRDGFAPPQTAEGRALARLPHHHQIRLPLLTRPQVGSLLEELLGVAEGRALADGFHRLTGGNPLLVRALAQDRRPAAPAVVGSAPSEMFRRAFTGALLRLPALALPVAKVVAVLERPADPAELSHALGVPAQPIERMLGVLHAAGMLYAGYFRHPCARSQILATMGADEQTTLLRRVAAGRRRADGQAGIGQGRGQAGTAALPPSRAGILPEAADDAERLALSVAEHRVAELAADGLTNKEIAGQLSITVSTVEQHLTRVYRKLVVARRNELAKIMGRTAA